MRTKIMGDLLRSAAAGMKLELDPDNRYRPGIVCDGQSAGVILEIPNKLASALAAYKMEAAAYTTKRKAPDILGDFTRLVATCPGLIHFVDQDGKAVVPGKHQDLLIPDQSVKGHSWWRMAFLMTCCVANIAVLVNLVNVEERNAIRYMAEAKAVGQSEFLLKMGTILKETTVNHITRGEALSDSKFRDLFPLTYKLCPKIQYYLSSLSDRADSKIEVCYMASPDAVYAGSTDSYGHLDIFGDIACTLDKAEVKELSLAPALPVLSKLPVVETLYNTGQVRCNGDRVYKIGLGKVAKSVELPKIPQILMPSQNFVSEIYVWLSYFSAKRTRKEKLLRDPGRHSETAPLVKLLSKMAGDGGSFLLTLMGERMNGGHCENITQEYARNVKSVANALLAVVRHAEEENPGNSAPWISTDAVADCMYLLDAVAGDTLAGYPQYMAYGYGYDFSNTKLMLPIPDVQSPLELLNEILVPSLVQGIVEAMYVMGLVEMAYEADPVLPPWTTVLHDKFRTRISITRVSDQQVEVNTGTRQYRLPLYAFATPVRGFRLTSLGRYCLGLSDSYEVSKRDQAKADVFDVADESMIVKPSNPNSAAMPILRAVAKPVGTQRYVLDEATVLEGCDTVAGIKKKVRDFKRYICPDPGPHISEFFQSLEKRAQSVVAVSLYGYRMLHLDPSDRQLLRYVSSLPEVGTEILKADGCHILVKEKFMSELRDRLAKKGYLL